MFRLFSPRTDYNLPTSRLFDEVGFYPAFGHDLERCRSELIIEIPFITSRCAALLLPRLEGLVCRGVSVVINTRHPSEHDAPFAAQAKQAIGQLLSVGVHVFYIGSHHRKIAIVDRGILWEGSLNILSQADSCEIMRRIESPELAAEMIRFTKIDKFLQ